MKNDKDIYEEKEKFISKLTSLSREDINTLIQTKGKKAKKRRLFIPINETN